MSKDEPLLALARAKADTAAASLGALRHRTNRPGSLTRRMGWPDRPTTHQHQCRRKKKNKSHLSALFLRNGFSTSRTVLSGNTEFPECERQRLVQGLAQEAGDVLHRWTGVAKPPRQINGLQPHSASRLGSGRGLGALLSSPTTASRAEGSWEEPNADLALPPAAFLQVRVRPTPQRHPQNPIAKWLG